MALIRADDRTRAATDSSDELPGPLAAHGTSQKQG